MKNPNKKIVEVPNWGTWEFSREEKQVVFWNNDVYEVIGDHPLIYSSWDWAILSCKATGVTIVVDWSGEELYRLDAIDIEINSAMHLNRSEYEDHGFYFLRLVEHEDRIIFIYEKGVACLDLKGNLKWRQDNGQLDWHYAGIENGNVLYQSEYDGRWGYKLKNGERVGLI